MKGRERGWGRVGSRREDMLEIGARIGDETAMANVQRVDCGMTRNVSRWISGVQ